MRNSVNSPSYLLVAGYPQDQPLELKNSRISRISNSRIGRRNCVICIQTVQHIMMKFIAHVEGNVVPARNFIETHDSGLSDSH